MSRSDRAQELNARAVALLDYVLATARPDSQPDLRQIASDVLSGKPGATLDQGSRWKSVLSWLVLGLVLIVVLSNKEVAGYLFVLWCASYLLPAIFSWIGDAWQSLTVFPQPFRAPKCEVTGCTDSASLVLNPTGDREIRICSMHRSRLERRVQYAALFRPEAATSLIAAYKDLTQAAKLDPHSTVIQENLKQAQELAEIVLERKLE